MDTPNISMFAVMGFAMCGLCIVQTGAFIRIPTDSKIPQTTSSDEKYECPYVDKGGDECDAKKCDVYPKEIRREWCCLTCTEPTTNSTTHTTATVTSSTPDSSNKGTPSTRAVTATVVFTFSTQHVDLTSQAKQQILVFVLRYYFDKRMDGRLVGLIIQHVHVRGGRLAISYKLEYDGSTEAASEFTKANIDLVDGHETVTILNETVSATSIQINTVNVTKDTVPSSSIVCEVLLAVTGPCHEDYYCTVEEDLPMCVLNRTQSEMFRFSLVIAVIAMVILCIILVCFNIRAYRLRKSASPEQRQQSLLASSTKMNDMHAGNKWYKIFRMPQKSQVNESSNRMSLTIDSADRY